METRNDLKKIAKEQNLQNYQKLTKEALAQKLGIPFFSLNNITKILQKRENQKLSKVK